MSRDSKLDTLRQTYHVEQEDIDKQIYTFSPAVGPTPAVASARTTQLELVEPGQLTPDALPTPTGYYEEIQRLQDNYRRRAQRMMFEKSLQLREVTMP